MIEPLHVSILIPTFNDCPDLLPCLDSLRRLDYPKNKMDICIWDNASRDDTVDKVRERFSKMEKDGWSQLKLIEWKQNEGSYIPYNLAQKHLPPDSDFILGLDADVELEVNALSRLIMAAQESRVAVVGARSVYFSQPTITAHGAGFVNRWTGFYGESDAEIRIECDYVIGCCWLLKKTCFESLGGFNPEYFINHWEVDYCLRAKNNGYHILYEPAAVARHKVPIHSPLGSERVYYMYRNKLILIRKVFSFPRNWIAMILNTVISLPKAILDSVQRKNRFDHREIKQIFRAFLHGWMNRTGK